MTIRRVTLLSLIICCFALFPVLIAGQGVREAHLKANTEIDTTLRGVKQACGADEKCLADVAKLEIRFSKFRTQNFDTGARLSIEKQQLLNTAGAIKPGSAGNDDNTNNEADPQRLADMISGVKTAVDEAKDAVALVGGDAKLNQRLKNLQARQATFEHTASRSPDLVRLTEEANAIKGEAQQLKSDADGMLNPSWLSSLLSLNGLIWALLSLLGVSVLALAVFSFVKLHRRVEDLELRGEHLRQSHERLKNVAAETKANAERLASLLEKSKGELATEIDELRQLYHDKLRSARNAQPTPDSRDVFSSPAQDSFVEVKPSFPALVSDYLSKTPNNKKKDLESDFRTNLLIPAPGGPFTLVEDDDGRGMGIVLPKPRLQKGAEFSSYYKSFYYCDSPSAGEVYITEPAIVNKSGAGWELYKMGTLEIR